VSTKQGQIIVALLAVSIILGGANTYLIVTNQQAQDKVNEQTLASLSDLNAGLQTAEEVAASNFATLNSQIAGTNATLAKLSIDTAAKDASITKSLTSVNSTLHSGVNSLRENLNTLESQTPAEIYEDTYRSVVLITASNRQGSGFLYDSDKHIVTNWHVVMNEITVEVTFYDGTTSTATVTGKDAYSDIAVIQPATIPEGVTPLRLGNSTAMRGGDPVGAVGNPLGVTGSLSSGYISRKNTAIDITDVPIVIDELQLDLTITHGSSGGALLNVNREIIGVTNAGTDGVGYCYAIPSNNVKRAADAIIEKGKYEHPLFGFSLLELSKDNIRYYNIYNVEETQRGLMITAITSGGAAQLAELKAAVSTSGSGYEAQDIILAIDGHTVNTLEEWAWYVEEHVSPGQTVHLTVWRLGEIIEVSVTPTARPQYS